MSISQLLHDTLLAWLLNNPSISAIIPPTIGQTSGNFDYVETSALEQNVVTVPVSSPSTVGSILLSMINVTTDTTISVYIRIDGVNYVKVQENNWTTADDDGVMISGFVTPDNFRLVLQSSGAGVGTVVVPWSVQ